MAGAYECLPCGSTLEIILVCTVISVDIGFCVSFLVSSYSSWPDGDTKFCDWLFLSSFFF